MKSIKAKKPPYFERVQTLVGKKIDEAFLLHYGHYVFEDTVEGAAKSYFKTLLTDAGYNKKAQKLGLV